MPISAWPALAPTKDERSVEEPTVGTAGVAGLVELLLHAASDPANSRMKINLVVILYFQLLMSIAHYCWWLYQL